MHTTNNDPMRLPLALQEMFQVCRDKNIPLYLAAAWFNRASRIGAKQVAADVYDNAANDQFLDMAELTREKLADQRAAEIRDTLSLLSAISGSRRTVSRDTPPVSRQVLVQSLTPVIIPPNSDRSFTA